MKRGRLSEEKIVGIVKGARGEAEDRGAVTGARRQRVDTAKGRYGGMEVGGTQRVGSAEDENRRSKQLLADLRLGQGGAEGHLGKKPAGACRP